MLRISMAIFIVLHGLVHLWYVVLSQRLVAFQPEMGWSGHSWLFSSLLGEEPTRTLASVLYALAAIVFIASGVGIFIRAEWWRAVLVGSALFSSAVILLFWDGEMSRLVEKGVLGLAINVVLLAALLGFGWSPPEL